MPIRKASSKRPLYCPWYEIEAAKTLKRKWSTAKTQNKKVRQEQLGRYWRDFVL